MFPLAGPISDRIRKLFGKSGPEWVFPKTSGSDAGALRKGRDYDGIPMGRGKTTRGKGKKK